MLTKPLDELPEALHDAPEVDEKKTMSRGFVEQDGLPKPLRYDLVPRISPTASWSLALIPGPE